ncbi:MAG: ABC transporter substrate-binding protein [Nitrospirae bacterium]|nr:ABC transporter substrate-binding protein [Nitrospirota bacterium]
MRKIAALCVLFIFLIPLVSCKSDFVSKKDELVAAFESSPTNLDPRLATDANSARIIGLIFNSLLRFDEKLELVPDLSEKWENPNPVTYIFHLKKGVKFHNGRELTAEDVKYTFESILNPSFLSPHRKSYEKIKAITALDKYTVKFLLSEPYAPFLINMTMGIAPKDEAERLGRDFANKPIGTGPFVFEKWIADERIELKRNTDYFEGKAKLSRLIFKIISDDTIRLLGLKTGEIDFIQNAIPPDLISSLSKDKNITILTGDGVNYSYLGFNLTDTVLKDKRVRKAIAYAIDRSSIINNLLAGLAVPATGVLPKNNWAYEEDLIRYEYNPDKARSLLDEAGFADPDGSGPKERFRLVYKTTNNDLRKMIGEVLQKNLKEVGIGLDIRTYEWGTFYNDIKTGNFQLYSLSWIGIVEPDIYYSIFHSDMMPPKGNNRNRYKNTEIDRLVTEGQKVLSYKDRKKIYSKVQKIAAEELPYISLWHPKNVAAMRRNVKGFVLFPDGDFSSFKNIYKE